MSTVPLPSLTDSLGPISEALNALTHDERVNWMRGLGRRDLKALYQLAEGHGVELDEFVPGEGGVVIHEGQNSLPLFTRFQKRFVRTGEVVHGYNHNPGSIAWFTGPGHFIARQEGDQVVIDYTLLPDRVPSEFPDLIDNEHGTRKLVFGGALRDRMWRVSDHCTIGAATKDGKPFPAWFMLTRTDAT